MLYIESRIAIAAITALLIGAIACEPAPEEPEIAEPNDEPEVEEEIDDQAAELQELQNEIEEMHEELANEYVQLDTEYQQLQEDDQIDAELMALVDRMGEEYRTYTEHYEEMHGQMQAGADNPDTTEEWDDEAYDEEARDDWEDPAAMFELQDIYTMIEHHTELNELNEEMADLNNDVDRDELADRHETLADMHQDMQENYEEMRDTMEDDGVT